MEMSNNAQWAIRYVDKSVPYYSERALYLASPDFSSPRKAHARARQTAKARLEKKLGRGKVQILSSECVG
jgi:hypothetical protein